MPLSYLLDENCRGLLWRHVQRHNARGVHLLDARRVGDDTDLPLGSLDRTILDAIEKSGRILVSKDERALPKHLRRHLDEGKHCPGIFLVRSAPLSDVIEFLVCAAHASDPSEWQDRVTFIP